MEENEHSLLNKNKKIDEFFDEVGYSKYQYFLLLVAVLVFFADGTEVLVISLILKSIQMEWNISLLSKSFIASSAFIGLMIGSFIASKFLDIYGRKKFLVISGIIILIFGYLSSLANDAFELTLYRLLMGIGIGAQIPATTNLAAESIPSYNRSFYLANMWIAFPVGELYVCIIAMNVMPNFEYDQWRVVLRYCLIPVILSFIGSFFLFESVRFNLAYSKQHEAKETIFKLAKWGKISINENRVNEIINDTMSNPLNKYKSNYSMLISKRFINLSLNTWLIWFFSSTALYITVYVLPQILVLNNTGSKKTAKNLFQDIIVSNLIAAPKTIIGGFLPEIKILGRKNAMIISFIITAISSFLLLFDLNNVYFYCGLIKLMSGVSMAVIKIYSTEAYPTKLRGLGYGTGHSFARFARMMVPFMSEFLIYNFGITTPFVFVFLISLLGVYNTYSLPFETLGRKLDNVEKEDMCELKMDF